MKVRTNRDIVNSFFTYYQMHEPTGMHSCLDPQVEFSDLAFAKISGPEVRAMWHWFCVPYGSRKEPVHVPSFFIVDEEGDHVRAEYQVKYSLGPRHLVDYSIQTDLTLKDGKIVRQIDRLMISNYQFARMALGFPQCLLALTPLFRPLIRRKTAKKLAEFQKGPR